MIKNEGLKVKIKMITYTTLTILTFYQLLFYNKFEFIIFAPEPSKRLHTAPIAQLVRVEDS